MRQRIIRFLTRLGACCLSGLLCFDWQAIHGADQQAASLLQLVPTPSPDAIARLTTSLSDESPLVRQAAAIALVQLGEAATPAVKALTQALSDREPRVRWAAATSLQRIGKSASSAESALIRATRDRDTDVQCAAFMALRVLDLQDNESVAIAGTDALSTGFPEVQFEALTTLAYMLPHANEPLRERCAPAIAQSLLTSHDDVRLAAVSLLKELGLAGAAAAPTLVRVSRDADPAVRSVARQSLEHLADQIDRLWNHLDEPQRNGLRRPCQLTAQALFAVNDTLTPDTELDRLATQFRQLADGIQLASNEQVREASGQVTQELLRREVDLPTWEVGSPNQVTTSSASRSNHLRLWIGIAGGGMLVVGLMILRQALRRPVAVASHSETIPTANQTVTVAPLPCPTVPTTNSRTEGGSTSQASSSDSPKPVEAAAPVVSIPQLLATLSSPDPSNRQTAMTLLSGLGAAATAHVSSALKDPSGDVRHAAAVILGQIGLGAIDSVPMLVVALKDREVRVRAASAFALAALGPHAMESVPELRDALLDSSPQVRACAAFALGQIGAAARRAIPELTQCLADSVVTVRRQAASALGGFGSAASSSLAALSEAAIDVDVGLRRNAVLALGMIDPLAAQPTLQRALSDIDDVVRQAASMALQTLAPQNVDEPDNLASSQNIAGRSLANDSRQLEHSTEQDTRRADSAEIVRLIADLESIDNPVRWRAMELLTELGVSALPEIGNGLRHRNPEVRRLLISVLSNMGIEARPLLPELVAMLRDDSSEVRAAAAEKVGHLGVVTKPMLRSLVELLSDANAEVRCCSATTLGRLGAHASEATVALQIASLTDRSAKVRGAAQSAHQQITKSLARAA